MAGAEARLDLIAFIGTTEVVPCYKTILLRVFHQAGYVFLFTKKSLQRTFLCD